MGEEVLCANSVVFLFIETKHLTIRASCWTTKLCALGDTYACTVRSCTCIHGGTHHCWYTLRGSVPFHRHTCIYTILCTKWNVRNAINCAYCTTFGTPFNLPPKRPHCGNTSHIMCGSGSLNSQTTVQRIHILHCSFQMTVQKQINEENVSGNGVKPLTTCS